jgi:hypothetical protein
MPPGHHAAGQWTARRSVSWRPARDCPACPRWCRALLALYCKIAAAPEPGTRKCCPAAARDVRDLEARRICRRSSPARRDSNPAVAGVTCGREGLAISGAPVRFPPGPRKLRLRNTQRFDSSSTFPIARRLGTGQGTYSWHRWQRNAAPRPKAIIVESTPASLCYLIAVLCTALPARLGPHLTAHVRSEGVVLFRFWPQSSTGCISC